jgi:hypothetical protein
MMCLLHGEETNGTFESGDVYWTEWEDEQDYQFMIKDGEEIELWNSVK